LNQNDLERGKKNKAAKYAATSTDAPTTTVYTTTTTGAYNNPYGPGGGSNGGGSASYGDPHFHVEGLSDDQPDICFDYNLEPGQEMILIDHPSFRVGGELFKPNEVKFKETDSMLFLFRRKKEFTSEI
jgi:hypothetical protein